MDDVGDESGEEVADDEEENTESMDERMLEDSEEERWRATFIKDGSALKRA